MAFKRGNIWVDISFLLIFLIFMLLIMCGISTCTHTTQARMIVSIDCSAGVCLAKIPDGRIIAVNHTVNKGDCVCRYKKSSILWSWRTCLKKHCGK